MLRIIQDIPRFYANSSSLHLQGQVQTPKNRPSYMVVFAHSRHRSRPRSGRPPRLRAAAPRTTLQLHPSASGCMASRHEDPSLFWYCRGFVITVATFLIAYRHQGFHRDGVFLKKNWGADFAHPTECKLLFFCTFKLNTFIDPRRLPLLQKGIPWGVC